MTKKQKQYYSALKVKLIYGITTVALLGAMWQGYQTEHSTTVLYASEPVVEETTAGQVVEAKPSPVVEDTELEEIVAETEQYEKMKQIVIEVFGEHADKALLLLTCENRGLNPEAKNVNTDERRTTDWGLFQINDYWQGIRHEGKAMQFLLDPEINARIAYRLYEDDGFGFKLWTCGRKLGI